MIKKIASYFLLLTCCYQISIAQSSHNFSWPKINRDAKPWVRWWWLGNAVDTTGLKFNLESFHDAGIGGVEITPIYGVKGYENKFIDYLSPKWMQMLHYTINESQQLNMGVDMNTGTGWPFGGPQININDAASRVIFQTYQLKSGERLSQKIMVNNLRQKKVASLQMLMAYSDKGDKIDLTKKVDTGGNLDWPAPSGNWQLIAVFDGKTLQQVKRASPGGEGLVMDHFSKQAVNDYLQRFTTAFAKSNCPPPHAFFNDSYEVFGADWTKNLFTEFEKSRGYKLQNYLPALTGKGNEDTVTRVIADYRQTLAEMLLENFTETWTHWAHQMHSITRNQAHGSPGNLLDLYSAVDIPEIESYGSSHFNIPGLPEDSLGGRPGKLDPLLLKFASSAAHVSGKKFASSETFTWLGEHFRVSLSQCKPVLDEMWLSGINHVFFHGSPYSPKDAPWPGWQFYAAVDFSRYNTIWKDIAAFNNYIGRGQSFLQSGNPDNDVLVYWPVQDVWTQQNRSLIYQLTIGNAVQWLSPTPFHEVCEQLMNAGYSFDYISDNYLQKIKIQNGLLQTPGAAYKALIIPPCNFISEKTLQQILHLAQSGATIIFTDELPKDVPGLYQLEQRRLKLKNIKKIISSNNVFNEEDKKTIGKGIIITGKNINKLMQLANIKAEGFSAAGLQYIRRKDKDGYIYFVSNLANNNIDQWIPMATSAASAVIYDLYNGAAGLAAVKNNAGRDEIYLQLKPGQSLLIKTFAHQRIKGVSWKYFSENDKAIPIKGKWKINFEEGMPAINQQYEMDTLSSWTHLSDSAKVFAGTAKYTISFNLPTVKADDWLLNLGEVDFSADVKVNGHDAGKLWAVPFETYIGKYLHPGKNILEIQVTNLAANRIADYDRKKINWKKFYEINFVNMAYKPFDASGWKPVPSGLLGPVTITPVNQDLQD